MTLDALWDTIGRLHPMVLHMPIGLLMGLGAWELWRAWLGPKRAGKQLGAPAVFLAWVAVASAAGAIGTGLLHELEVGDADPAVDLHKWLGIAAGVGSLLSAVLATAARSGQTRSLTRAYRVVLFLTIGVLIPAGHLGGDLTHGEGYLFEPLLRDQAKADRDGSRGGGSPAPATIELRAREVIASRCESCHGAARVRGGLRLSTMEDMLRGGRDGPAAVAGDPVASLVVQRMRLPAGHEDHMPPDGRPQPVEAEIEAIEAWIRAMAPGAASEASSDEGPGSQGPLLVAPRPEGAAAPARGAGGERELPDPGPPDAAAVAALRARLVHVQTVAGGSNVLWVDLSSLGELDDELAGRLLEPLVENVAELSMARTPVGDGVLGLVARMPRLVRLDVSGTSVTDAGVEALAGNASIQSLVLANTGVTDGCVETLATMLGLRRAYVWRTGIGEASVDWLALARPELVVEMDEQGSPAMETEPEVVVAPAAPRTPDATGGPSPSPEVSSPGGAVAKAPINTTCPVTGSPVDARFVVEYQGRTVGFCCENCPKAFAADPARFAGNLPR